VGTDCKVHPSAVATEDPAQQRRVSNLSQRRPPRGRLGEKPNTQQCHP
jgi:hypothetical protein